MQKFRSLDKNIYYSPKDIRMSNSRIVYWVIFPQGIKKVHRDGCISLYSIMVAHTLKKSKKLFEKYKGSTIERLIECDLGRWCIKITCRPEDVKLSDQQLWDKYAKLPEINL